MIPVGYMAKRVHKRPDRFQAPHVVDVYSVSNCNCEDFADYIKYWKHNGYWFFDSPEIIKTVAKENAIQLGGTLLFYYEAHEMEFDGEAWLPYSPPHVVSDECCGASKETTCGLRRSQFHWENLTRMLRIIVQQPGD